MTSEISPQTQSLFNHNRLAGHYSYVRSGEVVPHFFSKGSYYLTRNEVKRELLAVANSCLHRGFKLVHERRQLAPTESVVCRFHSWTYDRCGALRSAPGFDPTCGNQLPRLHLTDVNGFFFESRSLVNGVGTSLKKLFGEPYLSDVWVDDFAFDTEQVTFYSHNWRTFVEVYLDGYHVKPVHRGLGTFLKSDEMEWIFGHEYSLQVNKICDPDTIFSGTIGFSKYHEQVRKVGWSESWGAIFVTVYPGLMLEFFPHAFVVSQVIPLSEKMTANYVQTYFNSAVRDDCDFQNAFYEAYAETAQEDGELCDSLEEGRIGNWYWNLPHHPTLEAGYDHWHRWMDERSGAEIK